MQTEPIKTEHIKTGQIKTMRIDVLEQLDKRLLPTVILEIVELIGYHKAMLLVQALGGVDFAMPTGLNGSGREKILLNAIGREATDQLMQVYGGSRLYIPMCQDALRDARNRCFLAAVQNSMAQGSSQTVALQKHAPRYGVSERHGYSLLQKNAYQQDSKQLELLGEDHG